MPEGAVASAPDPYAPPDHTLFPIGGGRYAMRCSAWGLTWHYPTEAVAEFFLRAHLAVPVEPCQEGDSDPSLPAPTAPEVTDA